MTIAIGIRGAGAAGLSLAQALLETIPDCTITIADTRARLPHPTRTFCFFRDADALCPVEPKYTWNKVAFSGPQFSRIIDCYHAPYALISGDDFFTSMLAHLEASNVSWFWNCQHVSVDQTSITIDAKRHHCDIVFDTAYDSSRSAATLWQSFAGMWIETQEDCFDPNTATLMELGKSSHTVPIQFIYLLPTSTRSALVEHTTFCETPWTESQHLTVCHSWLTERNLKGVTTQKIEQGRIPMGKVPVKQAHPCTVLGTACGAVRASTGYAFQTIQQQARTAAHSVARALQEGLSLEEHLGTVRTYPAWMRISDALFLKALTRAPECGEQILSQLLHRAPERPLISFLAGTASFRDAFRVMRCAPTSHMLRALW